MRIKLTTDRAGILGYHAEGSVIDIPDREAEALVRSGQAVRVEPVVVVETAMVRPAAEAAVVQPPARRVIRRAQPPTERGQSNGS